MAPGVGDVLALIRSGQAVTRGDVLELTGLSRMTVAQRVDRLLETGLVVESGTDRATGGRRPRRLLFNDAHAHLVAVTVATRHTRAAVTDLAGTVLARGAADVAVADGPERTLAVVGDLVRDLLGEAGTTQLAGVGISVPGPVDPATSRPSQPPIMPGWDGYPVADVLGDALGAPVLVANDADAEAVGEHAAGAPVPALCYVKVSTGIGVGIVLAGAVYPGADGGAGDIGHVKIAGHEDALCQCGARGCLAAVASGRAVARELQALGHETASGRDVQALLERGDADATEATRAAGRTIGRVLATVVSLLNPSTVVLGGDLASAALLTGVRETVYPLSLPRATRHLDMRLARLGEDAGVAGLARMLVDREFAADAVNRRLGG
ncbi:ROK family transcriptional regulator [Cellulomonas hominis]|uniref:ROK family transcriptional regulator n=1 Tax=Cellulomonas hominis TaxID=156981 RepID=UPI001BCBECEC|nr:ROK family transcriptional regulator [Cellulomonas hominis]